MSRYLEMGAYTDGPGEIMRTAQIENGLTYLIPRQYPFATRQSTIIRKKRAFDELLRSRIFVRHLFFLISIRVSKGFSDYDDKQLKRSGLGALVVRDGGKISMRG